MEKYIIGEKFDKEFDFRETCFGICVKDDKILLTFKANKNEYALPGGGVEKGENFEACLRREFKEETGYEIKSIGELATIDCFWLAGGKWPMESLANIFVVEVGAKREPTEEGCEARWCECSDAENILQLPYQKKALEIYLARKNQSSNAK